MAIPTRPGVAGFFMSDPELTDDNGRARLFAWVGIQNPQRNEDGTYPDPTRVPLVMFNASAERAAGQFKSGDNFIATGRADVSEYNGQQRERFIASSIGPDNNLSTIRIDRGRSEHRTAAREEPARDTPEADPAAVAIAQRAQALGADAGTASAQVPAANTVGPAAVAR